MTLFEQAEFAIMTLKTVSKDLAAEGRFIRAMTIDDGIRIISELQERVKSLEQELRDLDRMED